MKKTIDGEARTKRITLNVSAAFDARLRALSKIRGVSVNEFAIRAVAIAMNNTTADEESAIAALIDAKKKYDLAVDALTGSQLSLFTEQNSDSSVDGDDTGK